MLNPKLMRTTRLGYFLSILASTILGSLLLTTIPALIGVSPRIVFTILGAMGALGGCGLGSRVFSVFMDDEPNKIISRIEYDRLFRSHLGIMIIATLSASLVGSVIGVWMSDVTGRNSITP
jgi:hypothetical protein